MDLRKSIGWTGAAALALSSFPAAASAHDQVVRLDAKVAPVSQMGEISRDSTRVKRKNHQDDDSGGNSSGILIGAGAVIAIGLGVAAAVSNNDDKPLSP